MMLKKYIVGSLIFLMIMCVSFSIASAYVLMPTYDTYYTSHIRIKNGGMNSTWWNNVFQAATNWSATNSQTNAIIGTSTSSDNVVYAASYAVSWYGAYTPLTHSSTNTTSFKVQLNSRTINRDCTDFNNFVTSVMVHELGHALGINDRYNVSTCIMGSTRDRNTLTTPQSDDIAGVSYIWN